MTSAIISSEQSEAETSRFRRWTLRRVFRCVGHSGSIRPGTSSEHTTEGDPNMKGDLVITADDDLEAVRGLWNIDASTEDGSISSIRAPFDTAPFAFLREGR
jgi:hypothetical protein